MPQSRVSRFESSAAPTGTAPAGASVWVAVVLAAVIVLGDPIAVEGGVDDPMQGGALISQHNPNIPPALLTLQQSPTQSALEDTDRSRACHGQGTATQLLNRTHCLPPRGRAHVAAGVGLRNKAGGVIQLTGAPPGSALTEAYLYWSWLGDSTHLAEFEAVIFNGFRVHGQLIGVSAEPCWNDATELYTMRADVTDYLHWGVNGDYSIELLSDSVGDGRSPWHEPHDYRYAPLVEGAGLIAVYKNSELPPSSTVYISDGSVTHIFDTVISQRLRPTLPQADTGRFTVIAADGQTDREGAPVLPIVASIGDAESGVDGFTALSGLGSRISHQDLMNGASASDATQLFDVRTVEFALDQTSLEAGSAEYSMRYSAVHPFGEGEPGPCGGEGAGGDGAGGDGATLDPQTVEEHLYDCVVVIAHALTVQ